jgi:NAD(P)-dependent dehydrogenase (short-subunit alcohol dehydrogenase family)
MTQRLQGKRAVVTDCGQYYGADIAALFREEGAHVIADSSDLTKPGAAEALIRDAGHVDILTYWPHDYRQTEEFRQRMAEVPAARLGSGRELAQTVLFLAGPESDFFYGQIIPFAGGWAV